MLCGSRFVCDFNIHELKTGHLVLSRDYHDIKGSSWSLCVRRSVNKNSTGSREDVIRTKDELLGLPLIIPRKDNSVEPSAKISRVRSKKRVHFIDESTDSDTDHEFKNNLNVHRRYPGINHKNSSDENVDGRSKRIRDAFQNSSSESDDNSHEDRDLNTSSDSQEDPEFTSHSFRSPRVQTEDRQKDGELTSSSESDDPRDRPRTLQSSNREISKGRSRSSRNRRYGRQTRENNSRPDKRLTSLDFYLKLEESGNERLKQCTANFTLDLVNNNRGMRKVRKYKYQTFFPDDVSGWANVITWDDLTNRDNCFVDKNGYFQIEAAVIVLNTKMMIEKVKPERLETIV